MARIIALDYGKKRTGIAVTDPLKITANPLETIPTANLVNFLKTYIKKEEVECIVVGMPSRLDGSDTHITPEVRKFISYLRATFSEITIEEEDEHFTSKLAVEAMIEGGMKKKDRQKKENIDKISASLILQSYLNRNNPLHF